MAKKVNDTSAQEVEMFKTLKVDKLYKNSKGEYFTSLNLAVLSEKGDTKKVSTISAEKKIEVPVPGEGEGTGEGEGSGDKETQE